MAHLQGFVDNKSRSQSIRSPRESQKSTHLVETDQMQRQCLTNLQTLNMEQAIPTASRNPQKEYLHEQWP